MMVLLIFWLIEYFACRNRSNFRPKFHKKATSGNTGLNFVLNSALLMSEFFIEMKTMEKISPVLPEVAFTWNFGRKFDPFLHAKYSINQKIKSTIILYTENITLYPEHEQAALLFLWAQVERSSRFSLKSASWASLAIFTEERKLSAAQILNLKILSCSKIQQISLIFWKENGLISLKMAKTAKFMGKEPILSLNMLLFFKC